MRGSTRHVGQARWPAEAGVKGEWLGGRIYAAASAVNAATSSLVVKSNNWFSSPSKDAAQAEKYDWRVR